MSLCLKLRLWTATLIKNVLEREFGPMATQADLDAAIASLKLEVANDIATVTTQLQTLQTELTAANGGTSAALDAAVAAVNQTTSDLHAKYAPPAPVPTPVPTPSPTPAPAA